MKFTEQEVMAGIDRHNAEIDKYMDDILPQQLAEEGYEVKDGMVAIAAWPTVQRLIRQQSFYLKGKYLQDAFRLDGWDVKMDLLSSDKLIFCGRIEWT